MANIFLEPTATYAPQIRAVLDLSLIFPTDTDADQVLPDYVIEMPVFLGLAEQLILLRFPLAQTYTGVFLQHIKNAVVYYTAALIAPSVPTYLKENFGDLVTSRAPVDYAKVSAALRQRASLELGYIDANFSIPKAFDVADGFRGW